MVFLGKYGLGAYKLLFVMGNIWLFLSRSCRECENMPCLNVPLNQWVRMQNDESSGTSEIKVLKLIMRLGDILKASNDCDNTLQSCVHKSCNRVGSFLHIIEEILDSQVSEGNGDNHSRLHL